MPQEGSSTIMVSKGQVAALKSFAVSQPFSPSIQKLVSHLLEGERPAFKLEPETEEAIGFIDWLSENREFALTVRDEIRAKVDSESSGSPMCDKAWEHYRKNGGKRKKLPIFYRNGFFLTTLLGHTYVAHWARTHERFSEYSKTRHIPHSCDSGDEIVPRDGETR